MTDKAACTVHQALNDQQPTDPRHDADAKIIDGILYVAMPDIVATLRQAATAYLTDATNPHPDAADYIRDLADDWEQQAQQALT